MRATYADEHGWQAINDLAHITDQLAAGFTAEFMVRPDGNPGTRRTCGFDFGRTAYLDPAPTYKTTVDCRVDVICAFPNCNMV
ncbi:unnamed protein product [marine sediment metagenome]|uniref:Uncharacterized protein n=1 Tax=marine sediment metagenome TaxID=412755 RepID=X0RLN5_9ZZZZ